MAQGSYDHPAYTARFYVATINSTAGASGTSGGISFPNAVRIRNVSATAVTAGTSATTGHVAIILNGTTSVGSCTLGTSAALSTATSGDLNSALAAGTVLSMKNGTDATGVYRLVYELHGDPAGSFS